ncbi:MAG TPA: Sec-independent protein translocase protein TatB [Terriglobales bacterium]|nr:Sec-independent protein translocase protein TatB [Terriglobales bacterium]
MSFGELIFLFVLALLVFGPRKLPEIARLVGKTMAELRRASNEFRFSLEEEIRNAELQEQARKSDVTFTPTPAVPPLPALEAAESEANASLPGEEAPAGESASAPPGGVPGTVAAPSEPWPGATEFKD